MHEESRSNPYKDLPGFWNRVNRELYPFAGPAQLGIGRTESPYIPPADPRCPVCGQSMAKHRVDRGTANTPTRLRCPE